MNRVYLILVLIFFNFSFAQLSKLTDFVYENNDSISCNKCIFFKIKNIHYKIDADENITINNEVIYNSEKEYLTYFSVYKKRYLIISYYDMKNSKSSIGFEFRGIIKLVVIDLEKRTAIKNYICNESFSLIQIKKLKKNGDIIVEKTIKPDTEDLQSLPTK